MKSPGAPSLRRDVERAFWREIATGLTSEEAGVAVGASHTTLVDATLVSGAWRDAFAHPRIALG